MAALDAVQPLSLSPSPSPRKADEYGDIVCVCIADVRAPGNRAVAGLYSLRHSALHLAHRNLADPIYRRSSTWKAATASTVSHCPSQWTQAATQLHLAEFTSCALEITRVRWKYRRPSASIGLHRHLLEIIIVGTVHHDDLHQMTEMLRSRSRDGGNAQSHMVAFFSQGWTLSPADRGTLVMVEYCTVLHETALLGTAWQ